MLTARNDSSFLKSDAWIWFKKLLDVYLQNGVGTFRNVSAPTIGQIPFRPTVQINYYGFTYQGYFETFQLTESEDNPYTRDYSLTYKFFDHQYTDDIAQASADPGFIGSIAGAVNSVTNEISRVLPGGLPSNPTSAIGANGRLISG
jgi:hypothetical protein